MQIITKHICIYSPVTIKNNKCIIYKLGMTSVLITLIKIKHKLWFSMKKFIVKLIA